MNEITSIANEITDLSQLSDVTFVPETAALAAEDVSTSTAFLPRLQINNSSSELVASGKLAVGSLALVYSKEKFADLGKEVAIFALTVRAKALVIPQGGGNPVSYYDRESDDFKKVMIEAAKPGMNGNMFGPEFLIWIPSQNTFATLYFSSDSMRRSAPALIDVMKAGKATMSPAAARIKARFIAPQSSKFKWWGVDITAESTPLPAPPEGFTAMLKVELEKFNNPPKTEVEQVKEPADERPR